MHHPVVGSSIVLIVGGIVSLAMSEPHDAVFVVEACVHARLISFCMCTGLSATLLRG